MDEAGFGKAISDITGKASQWMGGDLKTQKQIQQTLPTLDSPEKINSFFDKVFGPKMQAGVGAYAKRSTPETKLEILKQAAEDKGGLGKVRIEGQDIAYVPSDYAKSGGPSAFSKGRSRLGT